MTNGADQVLRPEPFEPTPLRPPRRRWFVPWLQLTTVLVVLVAAVILWFLFTAKSVRFESNVSDGTLAITGGIVIPTGDTYLMRPGNYDVQAEAEGYFELTLSIEVTRDGRSNFSD